jgi:hypothetical protein
LAAIHDVYARASDGLEATLDPADAARFALALLDGDQLAAAGVS